MIECERSFPSESQNVLNVHETYFFSSSSSCISAIVQKIFLLFLHIIFWFEILLYQQWGVTQRPYNYTIVPHGFWQHGQWEAVYAYRIPFHVN